MTDHISLIQQLFAQNLSIDSLTEDQVFSVLVALDDAYHNTSEEVEPLVSDEVYDTINRQAQAAYPLNPYFIGVGSAVREEDSIPLPYTMGSLTQSYENDVPKWLSGKVSNDKRIVLTDKLDGNSALLIYGKDGKLLRAFTRGDGLEGKDITRHILKIPSVPKQVDGELAVRTEVIIPHATFASTVQKKFTNSAGKPYKNPRNCIGGLLNASENHPEVYQHIHVVAYSIYNKPTLSKTEHLAYLTGQGFKVVSSSTMASGDITDEKLAKYIKARKAVSPYELDGIVLDINDADVRLQLGANEDKLNPEFSRKYKIVDTSNYAETTVKYVEWNLSKDRYWKPRIYFEPVELVGVTVQYTTGFNARFIVDSKIGPGAVISVIRSGDVTPFITGVISGAEVELPEDAEWNETKVDLICPEGIDNKQATLEQLLHFFSTLDVPKLKDGNLQAFVDVGVTQPEDIIDMTEADIVDIVGSRPIGKTIFNGIRDVLTNIPMYKLMGAYPAMGRGLGVRKMKKLWEAFGGDMSKCASVDNILTVPDFQMKTAKKVADGYLKFQEFYSKIEHIVKIEAYKAPATGVLTSKSFVFTEFRSKTLEEKIVAAGGKISSSVSKNTTYVVTTSPDGSSGKLEKARDLNIPIISPTDVENLINQK